MAARSPIPWKNGPCGLSVRRRRGFSGFGPIDPRRVASCTRRRHDPCAPTRNGPGLAHCTRRLVLRQAPVDPARSRVSTSAPDIVRGGCNASTPLAPRGLVLQPTDGSATSVRWKPASSPAGQGAVANTGRWDEPGVRPGGDPNSAARRPTSDRSPAAGPRMRPRPRTGERHPELPCHRDGAQPVGPAPARRTAYVNDGVAWMHRSLNGAAVVMMSVAATLRGNSP